MKPIAEMAMSDRQMTHSPDCWKWHRECRRIKVHDVMIEALEFIENYEDVIDGDYGQPRPNLAMQIASELRDLLGVPRDECRQDD